jgi:hypothetical protein
VAKQAAPTSDFVFQREKLNLMVPNWAAGRGWTNRSPHPDVVFQFENLNLLVPNWPAGRGLTSRSHFRFCFSA